MTKRLTKVKVEADWAERLWAKVLEDAKPATAEIALQSGEIERQLLNPTAAEVGAYGTRLSAISTCLALISFSRFAAAEVQDGWRLLTDSLGYALSSFKIAYAMRFPNGSPKDLNTGALLYCAALALKSRSVGEWTASFVSEVALNPKSSLHPTAPDDFQCLCYEFASETCGGRAKREWQYQLEDSLYGPLIQAESIDETEQAILELAVARGKFCSEVYMDNPPMERPPYNLFPIDILAILLMRSSDLIEYDFGCIESTLCHPPFELNWEKPDLLKRVEARVREHCELPNVEWE